MSNAEGPRADLLRRYELKFLLRPSEREALLADARQALEPDAHGTSGVYRVTSQYYDSPQLTWFWEKLDGVSVRRKARLRFYGEAGESPEERVFFLEIKHRRDRLISKERARLAGAVAVELLDDASRLADLRDAAHPAERQRGVLGQVERDALALALSAQTTITYRREAWFSQVDERLRLTFDHDVRALPPEQWRAAADDAGAPLLPAGWVVMELKFDELIPTWIRSLLVRHGVRQIRFSKYAEGVLALQGRPTYVPRAESRGLSGEPAGPLP